MIPHNNAVHTAVRVASQQSSQIAVQIAAQQSQRQIAALITGAAQVRLEFSVQHLESAALFGRQAYAVEISATAITQAERSTHFSYVMNSIMSSVFFAEATIAQFYIDLVEAGSQMAALFPPTFMAVAKYLWESPSPRLERASLSGKLNTALAILGKTPYAKSDPLFADMDLLVRLRNAFVHAKPDWDEQSPKYAPLARDLNKLITQGLVSQNPLATAPKKFPHIQLSHSLSEWGVKTAAALVADFYSRLAVANPYSAQITGLRTR
jgi:hypothetical protein